MLKLSAREVTLLIELSAKKNVSSSFIRSNDEGTCEACKRQVMYGQNESNCKFKKKQMTLGCYKSEKPHCTKYCGRLTLNWLSGK